MVLLESRDRVAFADRLAARVLLARLEDKASQVGHFFPHLLLPPLGPLGRTNARCRCMQLFCGKMLQALQCYK